jgi:hypothetical protein
MGAVWWYWIHRSDHMSSKLSLRKDERLVLSMHSRRIFCIVSHLGGLEDDCDV